MSLNSKEGAECLYILPKFLLCYVYYINLPGVLNKSDKLQGLHSIGLKCGWLEGNCAELSSLQIVLFKFDPRT